jgi:hypothetical protein
MTICGKHAYSIKYVTDVVKNIKYIINRNGKEWNGIEQSRINRDGKTSKKTQAGTGWP